MKPLLLLQPLHCPVQLLAGDAVEVAAETGDADAASAANAAYKYNVLFV